MELIKTYVEAANIFFEPGFANFKREKTLASMLVPKETAKREMVKAVTEYVENNPNLAEIEMRQMLLHVNGYTVNELNPDIVKKKFRIIADMFFRSGYGMIRKKYKWAMMFVKDDDTHEKMMAGIDWFVDTDYSIAKAKLLSLRSLLEMRMHDGQSKN